MTIFEKVLVTVPLLQTILFLLFFCDGYDTWMKWVYLVILLAVDLMVCIVLKEQKHMREKRKRLSLLYQQRERELEYYEQVTEYLHQMRVVRHEFANQMQVVYDLLEHEGDSKEIQSMLDQMNENLSHLNQTEKLETCSM